MPTRPAAIIGLVAAALVAVALHAFNLFFVHPMLVILGTAVIIGWTLWSAWDLLSGGSRHFAWLGGLVTIAVFVVVCLLLASDGLSPLAWAGLVLLAIVTVAVQLALLRTRPTTGSDRGKPRWDHMRTFSRFARTRQGFMGLTLAVVALMVGIASLSRGNVLLGISSLLVALFLLVSGLLPVKQRTN